MSMNSYLHNLRLKMVADYGKEPETLDELAELLIKRKPDINAELIGFSWDLAYRDLVSNSHACPLDGRMNWSRRDMSLPEGYPGFQGRIWIRFKKYDSNHFGSDWLRNTCTHTGTGGFGSYSGPWEKLSIILFDRYRKNNYKNPKEYEKIQVCSYSWDYKIFISDWPGIEEMVREQQLFDKLADLPNNRITHKFLWNDPEAALADQTLLESIERVGDL